MKLLPLSGLGLAPSANIGTDRVIFEPVHGSRRYRRPGIANPLAAFLAAAMLLDYLAKRRMPFNRPCCRGRPTTRLRLTWGRHPAAVTDAVIALLR